jgi:hypothetical protein
VIATRGKDRPCRGPELDELLANCLIIQDGATAAVVRIGGQLWKTWFSLLRVLFAALVGFVHVFDVSLEKKQVGFRLTIHL